MVLVSVGRDGIFRAMDSEPAPDAPDALPRWPSVSCPSRRDIAADRLQSGSAKVVEYLRRLDGAAAAKAAVIVLRTGDPKNVLAARIGFTPETLSRIFRELVGRGPHPGAGQARHPDREIHPPARPPAGSEARAGRAAPGEPQTAVVWFDRPLP